MAEIERFCVRCRTRYRRNGWRVDPASTRANAGGGTRFERRRANARSTAACATGHFQTEGRPRMPPGSFRWN